MPLWADFEVFIISDGLGCFSNGAQSGDSLSATKALPEIGTNLVVSLILFEYCTISGKYPV